MEASPRKETGGGRMTIRDAIRDYLPYLLSAITIAQMWMAGNKHPSAWAVAICNQLLWAIWIGITETWGLVPMNIALWVVCWRNHVKWQRSHEPQREVTVQGSRSGIHLRDSKTNVQHP